MKKNLNDVKHGKRNFGIFLLFLQCLAIYGATLEGNHFPINIAEWFGFLLCGIIGIGLIISDIKENKTSLHIKSSIILTIILLFSISLNIFQFLNPKIKIKEKIVKEELNYRVNDDGTVDIENDHLVIGYSTVNYSQILKLKQKIEFFDKYIVIIPDNANYYMSYDCWNNNERSNTNTFKIMNYKDAQQQGYWNKC